MFVIIKIFLLKNTFKVALHSIFNIALLIKTIFNPRYDFKLKVDPKMHTFKNLKKIYQVSVATLFTYLTLCSNYSCILLKINVAHVCLSISSITSM